MTWNMSSLELSTVASSGESRYLTPLTELDPQVFDGPASNVSNKRRKNEFDKIFNILKCVCDTHGLPLAQTWVVSPCTSCFGHKKVCMSTAVPYYVQDTSMGKFIEASKERHLEKSRGVAGRALSSRGSCFCGDVTKLDEEEYPLVHYARMSGLTSCFAVFLHSLEGDNDYVLEFFLPLYIKVLNLVQTLKQSAEIAAGFELGDVSSIEVVKWPLASTNASMERICDNFTYLMVNVTFNGSLEQFMFRRFSGLSEVVNKVAKRFKLEGQGGLRLKYMDEDNDVITICCDDDWEYALATSASASINLIYKKADF